VQTALFLTLLPTVFNLIGIERLSEWKRFRDTLEVSEDPFNQCAEFWARAPFVNRYLDYQSPACWPDPWRLVLDSKYDNLAIALGMLYTLQLTTRFTTADFQIYMTSNREKNDEEFYLLVNNTHVLNLDYGAATGRNRLFSLKTSKVFPDSSLK
jgi:hypothetical protein